MRIRKIIALGAAALLALGVMSGCTTKDGDDGTTGGDGTKYTIGMANLYLGGPYFVGMRKAVVENGTALGWDVQVSDAGGDADKLLADVENFIAKGVDAIVISGAWLNDFPAALDAAEEAGIPVVLVDRLCSSENFTAWIGPDNEEIGKNDGQFIVEQLPNGGVAVIIKGGPADNTIGIARTKGVTDALKAAGNFTIEEATEFGDWSSDGGKSVMENMLAKLPKIDVVFCENDSMCLGAQSAVADAGRSDEMFFAGVDGQNEAIQEILKGTNYLVTGYNDSIVIGGIAIDTLQLIFANKAYEKLNVVDSPMITIDNAEEFKNAGIFD
ncbi:MAG: substrate-binding domain-containing protein [Propionibacteriaceae bacterium]|nr:substrate-binding domain-containing protein [Propionibacteriaceae bacterium]